MLKTARNMLRRFGFVCTLLLTLASVMPAAAAQVCAPGSAPAVSASIPADGCTLEDCRDCGLACSHSCCHAPQVGVAAEIAVPPPARRLTAPTTWTDVLGAPLGAPAGPERPPRA
jgi:hypothetical protein